MSKKRRRARGTGTIFRSRGRWCGRLPIGRNSEGHVLYVERWGATQAEVIERLKEAGPPGPDVTVAEWARRWLDSLDVRESSAASYRDSVEQRIVPQLGSVRLTALTPHQINAAIKTWGTGAMASTVKKTLTHLRTCLRAAVLAELRPDNPASLAKPPRVPKIEIDPFTPAELAVIIAAARERGLCGIAILAGMGCRLAEVMALEVTDYDPAAQSLSITKQTGFNGIGTGPPKSINSTRTIGAPASVRPAILTAMGQRATGRLIAGSKMTLYRAWRTLLEELKIRYRNVHQLRHSVATMLVSAGVPIGDVAKYLGDSVETIVAVYVHPTGADVRTSLNRLLGP
jgi:integrase